MPRAAASHALDVDLHDAGRREGREPTSQARAVGAMCDRCAAFGTRDRRTARIGAWRSAPTASNRVPETGLEPAISSLGGRHHIH